MYRCREERFDSGGKVRGGYTLLFCLRNLVCVILLSSGRVVLFHLPIFCNMSVSVCVGFRFHLLLIVQDGTICSMLKRKRFILQL